MADRVTITARAPDRQWLLHADPEDAASLSTATGLALGTAMLRAEAGGGWHALHLSPDEWLLIADANDEDLFGRFAEVAIPHSLVDVSERTVGRIVVGEDAAAVLAGGCSLDLDRIAVGTATRTLFGKVTAMLWRREDDWRIDVPRSYEAYLARLLDAIVGGLRVSA